MKVITIALTLCIISQISLALLPPKFQWKYIDYSWQDNDRYTALEEGFYSPQSNLPSGIARWKNKLFVTVPRWKSGVPSSLNYINVNGPEHQALTPYPSWQDGFLPDNACCVPTNKTVISAFKPSVDKCDRLWVADNGVSDMANAVRQLVDPAIVIFDLNTDQLITRYVIPENVIRDNSVFSSIEVDCEGPCDEAFAYVTDMGANAIIVYDFKRNRSWRVEHQFFHFDPQAGLYRVGGIDFFWSDGVSSASLGPKNNATGDPTSFELVWSSSSGLSAVAAAPCLALSTCPTVKLYRDLYLQPTSSTKLFKISTELLTKDTATQDEFEKGVQIVGDRGPNSQVTATTFDPRMNVLFYTLLNKNGVGCWNIGKPFEKDNIPVIIEDCSVLEFPNDIKMDAEGNVWILSDRQSRFLYNTMDFNEVNFRVMTVPASTLIEGTACDDSKRNKTNKKKNEKKKSL